MRFSCDKCSAKYNIADEKVRGKVVAVKCSKCGNRITVNGKQLELPPEDSQAEERTKVAPASDLAALRAAAGGESAAPAEPAKPALADGWYAIIDGSQVGPMTGQEFASKIDAGKITSRVYCWRDGQGDWKRAADIPALQPFLLPKPATPPPVPKAVSAPPAERKASAQVEDKRPAAEEAASRPAEPVSSKSPEAQEKKPRLAELFESATSLAVPEFGEDEAARLRGAPSEKVVEKPSAGLADGEVEETAKKKPAEAGAPAPDSPSKSAADDLDRTEPPKGEPAKSEDLNKFLFEGVDTAPQPATQGKAADPAALVAEEVEKKAEPAAEPTGAGKAQPEVDPFAMVPDNPNIAKPEIGEQTRFFMQKAGVTKRNPWWKVALVAGGFVGVPAGVLFLLSQYSLVKVQVQQVDEETGEVKTVEVNAFGAEGLGALRDKLLGKKEDPKTKVASKGKGKGKPKPKSDDPFAGLTAGGGDIDLAGDGRKTGSGGAASIDMGSALTAEQLAAIRGDGKTGMTGPVVRGEFKGPDVDRHDEDGLDGKVVAKVIGENLKSFQGCSELEIKRNATFKGGKVVLTITIGISGMVKAVAIDKADLPSSLRDCLKDRAKRMRFPEAGGETETQIPLLLTGAS